MEIRGSCILVTGGTRGLGRQFAFDLAAAGARVGVCGTNPEKLEALSRQFRENGVEVWTGPANVSKEEDVERLFRDFVAEHGRIDALVNNAGITRDALLVKKKGGTIEKMPYGHWQDVIDVNLTGVFLCGREAAYHMVEQGTRGVIVSISSICRNGNLGQTNYTAAKAGVAAITVVWAKELARHGIRVAALAPGYVETEMTSTIREDVLEKIVASVPIRRMASSSEVSHALKFILENDYVMGRVIDVDGGLRL
jgi:3-oxoacyl-[acyl-carrier protein] reductase